MPSAHPSVDLADNLIKFEKATAVRYSRTRGRSKKNISLLDLAHHAPLNGAVVLAPVSSSYERGYQMRCLPIKDLVLAVSLGALLQPSFSARAASAKPPQQLGNSGNTIPLNATSTVGDCLTVEAVLLPYRPAAMLFSGYVAKNFAVVKTTISNHCDNRQFILHNIYFDYSDWALSGYFPLKSLCPCGEAKLADGDSSTPQSGNDGHSSATSADCSATKATNPSSTTCNDLCPSSLEADDYTKSSKPGQVATVGALDVQNEVTEDSIFSPRNLVINGLTLVGQVAQGYAFVGSAGAAMGIGAYNAAFVQNLAKFWPDRRLDQEKFLLSLGYRTDQSTAIAKDDHGSYYAFFPLATFLKPSLIKLFLDDPAVFINPAEALMPIGKDSTDTKSLTDFLLKIVRAIPNNSSIDENTLLIDLASQCPGDKCLYKDPDKVVRVVAEKYLFGHASLNSVKIVARGVMTIPVDSVPPTIDTVKFDNEDSASTWTVTPAASATPAAGGGAQHTATTPGVKDAAHASAKPSASGGAKSGESADGAQPSAQTAASENHLTGEITGKFLTGGTPAITALTVPDAKSPLGTDYYIDKSLAVVTNKSSDSSEAFTLILAHTLPSGSKLTFQVSRKSSNSTANTSSESSTAGTSTQLTSNKFVYTVAYGSASASPTLTKVTVENDSKTDVWQTPGKLSGTATGADLTDGTVAVSSLEIAGKTATVADYIGALAEVPKTSTATSLDFQLTLLKAVPDNSKVTFVVSTKQADTVLKSQPVDYTVQKPTASPTKPAVKAAKPGAKVKPTGKTKPSP